MASKINVAIIGVGNCSSSLVQGIEYYKDADETQLIPGLMHPRLGEYHISDINFTAAFDIDVEKVGHDLSEAIFRGPNNTYEFSEVPHSGVTVQRGMTHDGLGKYLSEIIVKAPGKTADITGILKSTKTDVVINYLPVHDDLRRALDTVSEHEEIAEHQWVEGIHIVLRKLWGALEASGVEEIEADGRSFDPRLHEAVSSAAGPEGQVVAVVQTGYVLDGQVVRPAMVLVGNGDAVAGGDGPGEQTPDGHAADQQTKNDANDDARDGGER